MNTDPAILYSFRRCPYAMRARLAILSSEVRVQLREITLRDKAPELLASSPKGSVPVVVTESEVIEESLGIMHWALLQADPEGLLKMPDVGYEWISLNDGPFKTALDHTKYSVRFPDLDIHVERKNAAKFCHDLNLQIADKPWMFGENCSLADIAILPFIRQFSNIDKGWFDTQGWQNINRWLATFLHSSRFSYIMIKYEKWVAGSHKIVFPNGQ